MPEHEYAVILLISIVILKLIALVKMSCRVASSPLQTCQILSSPDLPYPSQKKRMKMLLLPFLLAAASGSRFKKNLLPEAICQILPEEKAGSGGFLWQQVPESEEKDEEESAARSCCQKKRQEKHLHHFLLALLLPSHVQY